MWFYFTTYSRNSNVICDSRVALLSLTRMGMAVKLPGVDDVVENTVETARNRRDRSEERVAEPDGEHRVLLSERLAGRYAVSIDGACFPAYEKLHGAADERHPHERQLDRQRDSSVHYVARGDSRGQEQRDYPQVESQILHAGDGEVHLG